LQDLSRELGSEVGKGVKGQSLLLQHDARKMPQLFTDGIFLIPHQDGTLAIGSTSENDWTDPARTDDKLDNLYQKAMQIMPSLKSANVLCRWAGVRPRGQKRAPILGRHPSSPGVYIANGGFKIGFGVAIGVGEVMADLVLDGKDLIPPAFSVESNLT
jgi:Glycine/D-amino acid oxidases (deaminating)